MMASNEDVPNVDELLSRIGQLRQILGVQLRNGDAVDSSSTVPSKSRQKSDDMDPVAESSGLTKLRLDAVDEHDDGHSHACQSARGSATATDEATVALLGDVTFVRVVVDSVTWTTPPKFLAPSRAARSRGRLILRYQFPATSNDFQTLKKQISVPAKTVLPLVADFNHRRVALLSITPALVDVWSKSALSFRILHEAPTQNGRPSSPHQIARGHVRLDRILTPPFSFDGKVSLEPSSRGSEFSSGYVTVCVQLGSRQPDFADRVKSFVSRFGHPSRTKVQKVPSAPEDLSSQDENLPKRNSPSRTASAQSISISTRHDVPASSHRNSHELPVTPNLPEKMPLPEHSGLQPRLGVTASGVGRERCRITETSCDEFIPRVDYRTAQRRFSSGVTLDTNSPLASNVQRTKYGQRNQAAQSTEWRSAAVQTSLVDSALECGHLSESAFVGRSDVHERDDSEVQFVGEYPLAQSSLRRCDASTLPQFSTRRRPSTAARRATVADRLRSFSPRRLRLTVHGARELPLVKGNCGEPTAPSVFVSYRSGEYVQFQTSQIVRDSCNPSWHWSTVVEVPDERKSLVLKLWHRSRSPDGPQNRRDRVLGFISLDLSRSLPHSGYYDLIDLSQTSTGRVHLSLERESTDRCEHPRFSNLATETDTPVLPPSAAKHLPLPNAEAAATDAVDRSMNTSQFEVVDARTPSPRIYDEYLQTISKDFLQDKLKANMNDVERLLAQMQRQQL